MNSENLHFQISELHGHVGDLLQEIEAGEYSDEHSDIALAVSLGHLLDHINLAWNTRNLPGEQMSALSQEEFEQAMNLVPNFGFQRKLSAGLG